MRKLSEILTPSLRAVAADLGLQVEVFKGRLVILAPMWRRALSAESAFCRALVSSGFMTGEQMLHAVWRYRLGCTRSGGVIFWQIDHEQRIHDGKIMWYREDCHRDKSRHPTWVSSLLTRRRRYVDADRLITSHCFFGLHLLKPDTGQICLVESEKTAVIMSELFPEALWLATGGLGNVQQEKFRPLRGRKLILFPDTDEGGATFRKWTEAAETVMRQTFWEDSPPIHVSDLLERKASAEQKRRKIDIADYFFDL